MRLRKSSWSKVVKSPGMRSPNAHKQSKDGRTRQERESNNTVKNKDIMHVQPDLQSNEVVKVAKINKLRHNLG